MPTKVFVGNLSYSTTWQTLKDHFRSAGDVLHAVVLGSGNRSKGCGLVEFASAEDAQRAIANLDNSILDGRPIQVREDREPTRGPGASQQPHNSNSNNGGGNAHFGGGHEGGFHGKPRGAVGHHGGQQQQHQGGGAGQRARPPRSFENEVRPASTRLFVSNLSWKTTKQNLHLAFGKVPGLKSAEIEMTWNGRAKGSGIIEYETVEQAQAAIDALDKTDLDERTIYVQFDKFIPNQEGQQ